MGSERLELSPSGLKVQRSAARASTPSVCHTSAWCMPLSGGQGFTDCCHAERVCLTSSYKPPSSCMICDVSEAAAAIAAGEKVLTIVLVPFRNCRRTASIYSGSIESFGSTQRAWTMLFRRVRISPKRLTAETTRLTRSSSFEMR